MRHAPRHRMDMPGAGVRWPSRPGGVSVFCSMRLDAFSEQTQDFVTCVGAICISDWRHLHGHHTPAAPEVSGSGTR